MAKMPAPFPKRGSGGKEKPAAPAKGAGGKLPKGGKSPMKKGGKGC